MNFRELFFWKNSSSSFSELIKNSEISNNRLVHFGNLIWTSSEVVGFLIPQLGSQKATATDTLQEIKLAKITEKKANSENEIFQFT